MSYETQNKWSGDYIILLLLEGFNLLQNSCSNLS